MQFFLIFLKLNRIINLLCSKPSMSFPSLQRKSQKCGNEALDDLALKPTSLQPHFSPPPLTLATWPPCSFSNPPNVFTGPVCLAWKAFPQSHGSLPHLFQVFTQMPPCLWGLPPHGIYDSLPHTIGPHPSSLCYFSLEYYFYYHCRLCHI